MMEVFLREYGKIKFGILILLAASLPFYLKISNVLIGAAALVTVVNAISTRNLNIRRIDRLSLAFILFFILDVVGLVYTEKSNLSTGLFTLDKHQGMILLPLIFSDVILTSQAREKLLSAFVFSCFIASLICLGVNMHESITVYDKIFHEWLFSHDRISEPIGMHAVYFAMYLALCVLILLTLLRDNFRIFSTAKNFLLLVLVFYFSAVIVALGARTTIFALLCIVIVNLVIYGTKLRSFKIYLTAALLPVVFAGFIWLNPVVKIRFMDMLKNNYENSNYGSYFARTHIWVPGIEAIRENILFGVGTGDHQSELNKKYLEHGYTEGVRLEFNMHSQYLQTALNFGVIGVVGLLWIFYIQIVEGLRRRDLLYLSFIFLFMFACITEAMLVVNKGTVYFLLFSFIFFKSRTDPHLL